MENKIMKSECCLERVFTPQKTWLPCSISGVHWPIRWKRTQSENVGRGKPRKSLPRKRSPQGWATYELEQEMASGMGVLTQKERPSQTPV